MSEQTIQDGLYSIPVKLDKYTCLSLGATTIQTFMKNSSDKDGMGQFFTPLKVVQEMVKMVDIREGSFAILWQMR